MNLARAFTMSTIKNTLITGPTNGIGRETALALARQGHRLYLLCRNPALGQTLCDDIVNIAGAPEPVLLIADLGNMAQVRAAADRILSRGEPLHVLINNAGVVNTQRVLVDVAGTKQEQMFAVNHLGHFLLTRLLLPRLIETGRAEGEPARIVVVASEAHALFCKDLDFDDLNRAKEFKTFKVYGQSKLANILMARELVKRVDPSEVQINSLHPGAVNSQLGTNNEHCWYTALVSGMTQLFFISPAKGAETSIHLATADIPTQGAYYCKCKPHRVKPWAEDEEASQRLWQLSTELLQLE